MTPPWQSALLEDGLRAATAVARAQGLPADDPRVLSARGNLVVHLAPAPVVARVATLTARTRRDPAAWLRRELLVAAHAAHRGAPVIAPTPLVDPGPHTGGEHPVTLWTFHHVTPGRPDPDVAGAALAALHDACADLPGPLARLTPVHDQIDDALATIRDRALLPPATIDALHRRHAALLADLPAPSDADVVLHGDAHAGNLVLADGRWRWTDFEEACRGPVAWDLAVLAGTERGDAEPGRRALAAYAAASGTPVPADAELAPFAVARRLEAAVWLVAMADADPDRYARLAAERLAEILA